MFSRKSDFSGRLLFDRKSFIEIIEKFKTAGFSDIVIVIPNEYKAFKKKTFTVEEFVNLNYNFLAQILIAKNNDNETIKILFINNSNFEASFNDTSFPSISSESSKFFVYTNDPVRLPGLIDFIKSLLRESSLRGPILSKIQNYLLFIAYFYIGIVGFAILNPTVKNLINNQIGLFSTLFIFCLLYIFSLNIKPGGLYINKFEHPFVSFTKRIFSCDFKNNPIINSLISIIKFVLAGLFLQIIWGLLGEWIMNTIKFLLKIN